MPEFSAKRDSDNRSTIGPSRLFVKSAFGAGFRENVTELFRPNLRSATKTELFASPALNLSGFWTNFRDLIFPPKLLPLNTTSQPIAVKEIWSKNSEFTRVQFASISLHFLVLILLVVPMVPGPIAPALKKPVAIEKFTDISRFLPKRAPSKNQPSQGGGSGGGRDLHPASKGKPAPFAKIQFAPPRVHPVESAKLLLPPTIIGDPQILVPSKLSNIGDPHMQLVSDSSGPGGPNGIGSNNGDGIGDGIGDGLGDGSTYGTGGGFPCGGCNGNSMPICSFCPRAEYSDEAVKAKYEGIVVIVAVISLDGRATDIHVSKGLGLGLDQKAVEAVRTWHFKPAIGPDRKPIAVRVPIEVVFHLY